MKASTGIPVTFMSHGVELIGIIEKPFKPGIRGVVIVVGGPQYRVGSHRQFVTLSRYLAQNGFAVMRFDHQGVGDSDGRIVGFENIGPDIAAAIDCFFQQVSQLSEVVICGLCDAASAAMMYAHSDRRVAGLALLNPWVRSEAGLAKTYLENYYVDRLRSVNFWHELFAGKVAVFRSVSSFLKNLVSAVGPKGVKKPGNPTANDGPTTESFIDTMREGLRKFSGEVMFVLSGNDLTAREFSGLVARDNRWASILRSSRCAIIEIQDANHTFSSRKWSNAVGSRTKSWLESW